MNMPRHGVHAALEAEANRLIKESMAGVTSQSAKSDILTPWKEKDRRDREVYVESGVPEVSTFRGMYNRAWNPEHTHLNSRDGVVRAKRIRTQGIQSHVNEYGDGSFQAEDSE